MALDATPYGLRADLKDGVKGGAFTFNLSAGGAALVSAPYGVRAHCPLKDGVKECAFTFKLVWDNEAEIKTGKCCYYLIFLAPTIIQIIQLYKRKPATSEHLVSSWSSG